MAEDKYQEEHRWIHQVNVDRLKDKLAQTSDLEERKAIESVLAAELKNLHGRNT